ILANWTCDLIITDIRMPGINGIVTVERAREYNPAVGVIFMTGYADLSSAKDAIQQGASDYIMKPFELSEIREAVSKAIDDIKVAEERGSASTLNHISSLNQMLFQANDYQSMVTSSLRFAMMQLEADNGSIIFRSDNDRQTVVGIVGDDVTELESSRDMPEKFLDQLDSTSFREPMIIEHISDLPFWPDAPEMIRSCGWRPDWSPAGTKLVAIPVSRSESMTGLILLSLVEKGGNVHSATLAFLSITASQLAMNLENLSLLEETRLAYSQMKDLQDQTIELEKMALRGRLSAEIGHELNNFLAVVAGNASMMEINLARSDHSALERHLQSMNDTIEQMKRFTGDLMELRQTSSVTELISFDKLINDVIDYLRPQKRFDGVSIKVQKIDSDIPFRADVTQIQQVLYNLFNNSADATRESDDREIRVNVHKAHDGQSFEFIIEDTGDGFSDDVRDKAFSEQFTTKKDGHGFGLVVCGKIIRQHGGQVVVSSTTGMGASIKITFPLAPSEEPVLV
ncbi:MAG: ATP-binding protein, partial [candidate division Zixibacteria bacterium]